eukprot:1000634-Pleurochrysis_carterae.AAC.1
MLFKNSVCRTVDCNIYLAVKLSYAEPLYRPHGAPTRGRRARPPRSAAHLPMCDCCVCACRGLDVA